MTWEELIEKLKDTNIDLTNEFKFNEYSDISKKENQNEFEKFGLTPDILFTKAIDVLITNFHLPKSTLIMLVSALAGKENIMNAYKIAVENKYRFFSFGDAMFIKEQLWKCLK